MDKLFIIGDNQRIWQKYCGFFDLSLKEFMEIQQQLLVEEIELVADSPLGRKIMNNRRLTSVAEFRRLVPLTTYDDYMPYLEQRNEDILAEKPYCWVRTSGRGGSPKWIPRTQRDLDWVGKLGVTALILACTSRKGEIHVKPGMRVMQNLPPRPYYSGISILAMLQQLELRMIPPLEEYEDQPFEKRIEDGFKMALGTGVDVIGSLTAVLVRMGERFTESSRGLKISRDMLHPKVMLRLIRALLKSKREKRALLPKDLWPLKGLICYGMDTSIYREQLMHYWGKEPLEVYGGTEMGLIATQAWNKKWMTFIPFSSFLEFVPEEEWLKSRENRDYQPPTVLLDEVKAGKRYEVIITNFYGMPFLRYRVGDLIKIVSLQDEEAGIQLPQMVFESRIDDIVDIAGFARLDEKTIWMAIANTGIRYNGWSARKEYELDEPILHIYIEPKDGGDTEGIEHRIHDELKAISSDYRDLEDLLGRQPLRVTLLSRGSFRRYYEEKRKAGADLAHLKPPQINTSDADIQKLLYPTQGHYGEQT